MRKSVSQSSPKPTNTLFNYFNKTADNKTNGSQSGNSNAVGSTASPSSSQTTSKKDETRYQLYDLVWAKLEGYSSQIQLKTDVIPVLSLSPLPVPN